MHFLFDVLKQACIVLKKFIYKDTFHIYGQGRIYMILSGCSNTHWRSQKNCVSIYKMCISV